MRLGGSCYLCSIIIFEMKHHQLTSSNCYLHKTALSPLNYLPSTSSHVETLAHISQSKHCHNYHRSIPAMNLVSLKSIVTHLSLSSDNFPEEFRILVVGLISGYFIIICLPFDPEVRIARALCFLFILFERSCSGLYCISYGGLFRSNAGHLGA